MTDTATALDGAKLEAFGGRMLGVLNDAMAAIMISIGHQVGLFDTMAGMRPATSSEIADRAGLNERYVREWLGAMVTSGIVEYDGGRGAYALPPEHAAMTTRAAGPNNFAAFMRFVPMCAGVEAEVIDKFRHGGGVPYSSYPTFHEAMAEISGATFDATLIDVTLPLVPGMVERLGAGGATVADVGTGSGHAVNLMARAFPGSEFVGLDFSEHALAKGRAEASAWGLTNATFEVHDAAVPSGRTYDFITTFDAVHDQAQPLAMVQAIHDSLKPGGYWLCVDIQASSHVGENVHHPFGTFGYAVSCTHCMTVSLAYDGVGLGAMWGVQAARELFARAGFADVQVHAVEGDPFNNYYVCRRD